MAFILIGPGVRDEIYLSTLFRGQPVAQTQPVQRAKPIDETEQVFALPTPKKRKNNPSSNAETRDEFDDERSENISIDRAMSHPALTLNQSATIDDAWTIIVEREIRHVPIVDDAKRVVGIVSDRDILSAQATQSAKPIRLQAVMNKPVMCASADTTLDEAALVMTRLRIGCLPVTDDQGQIKGIVTRKDLLNAILSIQKLALWL